MSEEIAQKLNALPEEIMQDSIAILNTLDKIKKIEPEIDGIEVPLREQIWGDKSLTNETQRKAAYLKKLSEDDGYKQKCITRDRLKQELELTRIYLQRKRDTMNCLIAIAGMMK